jgi:AAA domain/RepB DNA-primase N-terminal domain/Primase C terminal 2 (PriCT-2)
MAHGARAILRTCEAEHALSGGVRIPDRTAGFISTFLKALVMTDLTPTTPVHDKDMARDFLAGLDPRAHKFTFQFFSDGQGKYAEIFHGTLDEMWPKVQALNTPERGVGVFVTVNETDFNGRRIENIMRPRALFADADSDEQITSCMAAIEACGATPSMIVESGRGQHFYYVCPDIPLDQFCDLQKSLIDKFGSDPAVTDLPRVMRLPGTLHLKNPVKPRLVKLCGVNSAWHCSELVKTLKLSPGQPAPKHAQCDHFNITPDERERCPKRFADRPIEALGAGIETNIENIRSAVSEIPPSAISTEQEWMRFARGLAHEAAAYPDQADQLWDILNTASRRAPNYDEAGNESRWQRYIDEAFARDRPITIASVFDLAKKHGWPSGTGASTNSPELAPIAWSAAELKVSFSDIPHRQWLYGTYLIRGEITVLAAPGGAGKTALANGIAIEIANGREKLGERVWKSEQKVLYVNGEDSSTEIQRRLWAFCQQHKFAEQDLVRLYAAGADDTRIQSLSFLCMNDKGASALNESGFNVLESALQSLRPDLLMLDPLVVFCGGGNMNDNAVMSLVMRKLKSLAVKYHCAILVVHHTRKGRSSDPAGEAESVSGAAAIVNLARRAIMPVTMTNTEAKEYGVLPSQRLQYFRLVDAKSNLAPLSADAPWYELASEELPNAEPPTYPNGDRVQAVKRAYLTRSKASSLAGPEQLAIRFELMKLVDRGLTIDGEKVPYSPNSTGNNKQRAILEDAMAAVERATKDREWLPRDLRATAERELEALKHDGWVVVEKNPKGRFRRGYGLRPIWDRTPWAKERERLREHGGPTVRTEEEEQELNQSDLKKSLDELCEPNGSIGQ